MSNTSDALYTILELSRLTGISDRTIRKYIHEGKLKGELRGGRWMFTYEQVRAFVVAPDNEPVFRRIRSSVYNCYVSERRVVEPIRFIYIDIPGCDEETLRELINVASLPPPIKGATYCFYVSDGVAHLAYYGTNKAISEVRRYVFANCPNIARVLGGE
ncbi:MAG: helix-turn-helix domain-containing protein [Clostridia bacterium]|nr:helix-turn-helix domain-containing protein [Clostridia bacterium]